MTNVTLKVENGVFYKVITCVTECPYCGHTEVNERVILCTPEEVKRIKEACKTAKEIFSELGL